MATINRDNVQYYVDSGLINPSKIKIDLNKTKTAGDNVHRWVTLADAIKSGYDFNFDYDVKEIKTPKVTTLPDLVVNGSSQPTLETKPNYALKNFEDTFGVSARDAASFVPYVGDALDINDIWNNVIGGKYKEAAIGAGMFLVPNIVEKPVKRLWKAGKQLRRNYQKIKNFKYSPAMYNDYADAAGYIVYNYLHKYGDVQGGTIKDRARGLKKALELKNKEIKDLYLKDPEFEKFINDGNFKEYFEQSPEYAYYAFKEGLDPSLKSTANQFIKRQETSVRGVNSLSPEEAKIASTTGYRTRPFGVQTGGDQIGSRGGLYTTNSGSLSGDTKIINSEGQLVEKVGNRFTKPFNGGEGDLMLLHTDFGVDPNLEPLEQIRQFKSRSIDFDVVNADRIEKVTQPIVSRIRLKKKSVFDTSDNFGSQYKVGDYRHIPEKKIGYIIKNADPRILAIQHPYFDPSVYERVLVTTKPEAKLADIVDQKHFVSTTPRTDRWSGAPFDYNDQLFLPYAPSNDFRTLLQYSRIREYGTPKIPNAKTKEIEQTMLNRYDLAHNLAKQRAELHDKLNKVINTTKTPLGVAGAIGTVGAIGYGLNEWGKYREKQDWDAMSDSEFDDYYRNYADRDRYIDSYALDRTLNNISKKAKQSRK